MGDPSRPASRWSGSASVMSKSASANTTTTPLIILRRKLFRQSANKKIFTQRIAQSRNDIEELFRLYYSNDLKFDNTQRQIVTGKHIPTDHESTSSKDNLTSSSTNLLSEKHFVSREQLSVSDMTHQNQQKQQTIYPPKLTKRSVRIRTDNNTIINLPSSPVDPSLSSTKKAVPPPPTLSDKSSSTQQDDLCDSSFVKSVSFFGDIPNETEILHKRMPRAKVTQRPLSSKSSLSTIPPPPPFLIRNGSPRKDQTAQLNASFPSVSPALGLKTSRLSASSSSRSTVRQGSPSKVSISRQRMQLNTSMTTISPSSHATMKACSPSICSPISFEPDMPEPPASPNGQRVVSIPSKCNRYILVTCPEAPLRYNAPSYVERLLLPERFPTLFQNIVNSYDHHLITESYPRHAK